MDPTAIIVFALLALTAAAYSLGLMVGRKSAREPVRRVNGQPVRFEPRPMAERSPDDTSARVSRVSVRRTR